VSSFSDEAGKSHTHSFSATGRWNAFHDTISRRTAKTILTIKWSPLNPVMMSAHLRLRSSGNAAGWTGTFGTVAGNTSQKLKPSTKKVRYGHTKKGQLWPAGFLTGLID